MKKTSKGIIRFLQETHDEITTTNSQRYTEGWDWLNKHAKEIFKYSPRIGAICWFKGVRLKYTKDGWIEDPETGDS